MGTEPGWEQNKAHLYAIEHLGSRYSVKQIVIIATGLPAECSVGGAPGNANAVVVARGFEVVKLGSCWNLHMGCRGVGKRKKRFGMSSRMIPPDAMP